MVFCLVSAEPKISTEGSQTHHCSRETSLQWDSIWPTCCCPLTRAVLGHPWLPQCWCAPSAPSAPMQRVLQQVQHQLCSLARSIDLSYVSGPSYKLRLGFRALLRSFCYHVRMPSAFSFIVIPCPCSNLLFFPTFTAVNPTPGCL